jgi:hypothetical protein
MGWEMYSRRASGSQRLSPFAEWVCMSSGVIRISKAAYDKWFKSSEWAVIFMDREVQKLAVKLLAEPTPHAFKIGRQGDVKNGKPNYCIVCRSAVNAWNELTKTVNKGRRYFSISLVEDGLLELVPFKDEP